MFLFNHADTIKGERLDYGTILRLFGALMGSIGMKKCTQNPFLTLPRARNGSKIPFKTDFCPMLDLRFARIPARLIRNTEKNGHEVDLEMSPRRHGTTVFEEIYIRTMGN